MIIQLCEVLFSFFEYVLEQAAESQFVMFVLSFTTALLVVINYSLGINLFQRIYGHQTERQQYFVGERVPESIYEDYYRYSCYSSPINIDAQRSEYWTLNKPLKWKNYNELPVAMVLENNGEAVVLRAIYGDCLPTLSGADLPQNYRLHEITFKWGWLEVDGSEHALNYKKFSLEMQALHQAKTELINVAYFFELAASNPLLNPIVENLRYICAPFTKIEIPPFPLELLVQPFDSDYYSYTGCFGTQTAVDLQCNWFIYPRSFGISAAQLAEFRQLRNHNGSLILRNSRNMHPVGNRKVWLNVYPKAS